ncbi:MAG: hypothetical protein HZB51_02920 [Chloroflexi bacterium]|nr:hypothetical protein [Chloroflexota bacterium]
MDVAEITLRIVPVDQVILHEGQDPLVIKKLGERLRSDGLLRNPPIVAQAGQRYIVLDGATRTGALNYLGVRDTLVQIVDYAAHNISLDSWYHLIVKTPPSELLARISGIDGTIIERVEPKQAEHDLTLGISMCYLKLRNGATYNVIGVDHLELNIGLLNRIVDVYRGRTDVYRAVTTDLNILTREYPDLQMIVVFPRYTPAQVTRLALNGAKLPMGITRHLIGGRAIGINLPLERLESNESLEEKNAWLQKWLMEKIHERKVRFYQEPVFVFDE